MRRFGGRPVVTIVACLAAIGGVVGSRAAQANAPAGDPAAVAAPPRPATTQPAPIIHVDNIEHDFGDVWVGPEVEHTFEVSNRGSSNLEIRGVSVDCGCTSINDYPHVIEPGQSGKFTFRLRTIGLNGRIAPKKATITSNDPVTPQLILRLLGTFKKRIDVVPPAASFGTLIMPNPVERIIKITNNTDKPLQLALQPVKSEHYQVELIETGPGKVFDLKVTTVTPYKPGIMQAVAEIQTNLEEEPVIRVALSGRVPDRLDLYPPVANYVRPVRPTAGQTAGSLYFWLNNYGASLVNVKAAVVDDPAIKTTVEARAPGKNYRIQVDVPLNASIPPSGRILTVETDDPEKPTLQAKIMTPATAAQNPRNPSQPPATPKQNPAELMVGKPAPSFKLSTFESRSLATEDLKDRLTVLNFVSPTCGYCKKQIPELEKIRQAYEGKGVRFVNVFNTNPSRRRPYTDAEITQLLTTLGSKLEVAADPALEAGSAFQVRSYPTCMLIGKDGKVAAVDIGSNRVQLLPAQLDALLAGKPIPSATQPH